MIPGERLNAIVGDLVKRRRRIGICSRTERWRDMMNLQRTAFARWRVCVLGGVLSRREAAVARAEAVPMRGHRAAKRWSNRTAASIAIASMNGARALGPDLSDIGSRRTARSSSAGARGSGRRGPSENRFVRFVTKEGATITGQAAQPGRAQRAVDHPEGRAQDLSCAPNLRDYTVVDKGLMPSVQGKLTDQQVADIVSYLSSLKGPGR